MDYYNPLVGYHEKQLHRKDEIVMSNFFMIPSQTTELGITISTEMNWENRLQKVRIVHMYEIDCLLPILQVLNGTVSEESLEHYNSTDSSWLFLSPFMDGDKAYSNIIFKGMNGETKILGVVYVAKFQNTILRAIKHWINNEKKVGI